MKDGVRLGVLMLTLSVCSMMGAALCEEVAELRQAAEAGEKGDRSLHYAACRKSEACVDVLLRAGASVNATNRWNQTALVCATLYGWPAVVRCLLQAGAVLTHPGGDWCVIAGAVYNREIFKPGRSPLDERFEVVRMLIEAGGQLECNGRTFGRPCALVAIVSLAEEGLLFDKPIQWREYEKRVIELLLRSGVSATKKCYCHQQISGSLRPRYFRKSPLEIALLDSDKRKAAIMARCGVFLSNEALQQLELKRSAQDYVHAVRKWLEAEECCPVTDVQNLIMRMLAGTKNTEWLALLC